MEWKTFLWRTLDIITLPIQLPFYTTIEENKTDSLKIKHKI